MTYTAIFSKSFSRHEQKKFGCWAIIGSFILALSSFYLLKPFLGPLPVLNFRLSVDTGLMLAVEDTSSSLLANVSSSRPLNIISSQTSDILLSSDQQSNRSIPQQSPTSSSQQSNINNSHQSNTSIDQQSYASTSQQSNKSISQHSNTSISEQSNVSSSVQSNMSSSQQSNKSNSQQPNANISRPSNIGNSQQPNISISQPLNIISPKSSAEGEVNLKQKREPLCNAVNPRCDICDAEGDIRIHGRSVFAASSQRSVLAGNESWTVKPYARKTDKGAMSGTNEIFVKDISAPEEAPTCSLNHSVPAIVFSTGGYSGNHFHSFTDVIIPLFVASSQFHGEVQFAVTNFQQRWINKFQTILQQLTKYEIINIDTDDRIHCFPRVIVGLKQYKDLRIDPLDASKGYSIREFRQLISNAYSLKRSTAIKIGNGKRKKQPKLLIISRKWTRGFQNVNEIAELARSLGFKVVVSEASTNLEKFSQVVNSCDVMLGVHGAGLTNFFFLPTNAILIQVLPWGGFEWLASTYFQQPILDTDIRYLQYQIKEEESSLIQQYPIDHPVFRDPKSVHKHDWAQFKSIYLEKQSVKLDLGRFKATLLEALELLHH